MKYLVTCNSQKIFTNPKGYKYLFGTKSNSDGLCDSTFETYSNAVLWSLFWAYGLPIDTLMPQLKQYEKLFRENNGKLNLATERHPKMIFRIKEME
jgi:hypothetical protein